MGQNISLNGVYQDIQTVIIYGVKCLEEIFLNQGVTEKPQQFFIILLGQQKVL
jgi:hypothetical protein